MKAETDDKKPFEIKGKYLLVILNKKFFPKKKSPENTQNSKPLLQSECVPDKKNLSSDKKNPKTNKLYASASPSTLKSQPKKEKKEEPSPNIKSDETVTYQTLTHSEKLDTNEISKAETSKNYEVAPKTDVKSDLNKSETIKADLLKQKNETPENTKLETKKSEELEYVYSPKTQKTTSATLKKSVGPASKSKKAKKNEELLESLVDKALENQNVEKKFMEDMAQIDECVYLTKLKNMEEKKENTGIDSDNGESAKIKKLLNSSYDVNRDYRENFDLSPESLAKKYEKTDEKTLNNSSETHTQKMKSKEKKRYYSPNTSFKNNTIAVDNTEASAVLLENEVWRYVKNYSTQINYLKLIVYALDKKLAV